MVLESSASSLFEVRWLSGTSLRQYAEVFQFMPTNDLRLPHLPSSVSSNSQSRRNMSHLIPESREVRLLSIQGHYQSEKTICDRFHWVVSAEKGK